MFSWRLLKVRSKFDLIIQGAQLILIQLHHQQIHHIRYTRSEFSSLLSKQMCQFENGPQHGTIECNLFKGSFKNKFIIIKIFFG